MTTEYQKALKHLERQLNVAVEINQNNIKRTQERVSEQMAHITSVAAEFLSTGIADITDKHYLYDMKYHGLGFGHLGWRWPRFIKDLAIENKRPAVITWRAATYRPESTIRRIEISKFKYTQPLVSMFMLLGDYSIVRQDSRWFYVTLNGNQGDEAYATWRKECASNPGYLRALRIIT
jgi:hypothetical protein